MAREYTDLNKLYADMLANGTAPSEGPRVAGQDALFAQTQGAVYANPTTNALFVVI